MSKKILSASARVAVAGLVLATTVVAQSDKELAFVHVAGAQQRLRYLAARQDLVRPGRGDPRNGAEGPAAEGVGGARGCASRRAAAVHVRHSRERPRRQHAEIRVPDSGRHDDPCQVQRRIERWATARSFQRSGRRNSCGLSGSSPIRSIRSRSTAATARPTRCRARGHAPDARTSRHSNHRRAVWSWLMGTTPTRDGAGARSMKPSRICQRARCVRDSARISTRSRSWRCSSSTVIESPSNSDWSAGARSIQARATPIHSKVATGHLCSSSALMARRAASR